MAQNQYDERRPHLSFFSPCTFGRYPAADQQESKADIAVLGATFDCGTQYRSGAIFCLRGVCDAFALFYFGHSSTYDFDDEIVYLPADTTRITHANDDIVHTDAKQSHSNIESLVRAVFESGASTAVIDGNLSVDISCVRTIGVADPTHISPVDALLDFLDERHRVKHGSGNPMRRVSELHRVWRIIHVGIRNVFSSNHSDCGDTSVAVSTTFSMHDLCRKGKVGILETVPDRARRHTTTNCNGHSQHFECLSFQKARHGQ